MNFVTYYIACKVPCKEDGIIQDHPEYFVDGAKAATRTEPEMHAFLLDDCSILYLQGRLIFSKAIIYFKKNPRKENSQNWNCPSVRRAQLCSVTSLAFLYFSSAETSRGKPPQ
jgi:hypothetical protein